MEGLAGPSTSTVVQDIQPAQQEEASTSQQPILQPNAAVAQQHLILRLVPKKKKKKKVRLGNFDESTNTPHLVPL